MYQNPSNVQTQRFLALATKYNLHPLQQYIHLDNICCHQLHLHPFDKNPTSVFHNLPQMAGRVIRYQIAPMLHQCLQELGTCVRMSACLEILEMEGTAETVETDGTKSTHGMTGLEKFEERKGILPITTIETAYLTDLQPSSEALRSR